jgi:hypothetical protein
MRSPFEWCIEDVLILRRLIGQTPGRHRSLLINQWIKMRIILRRIFYVCIMVCDLMSHLKGALLQHYPSRVKCDKPACGKAPSFAELSPDRIRWPSCLSPGYYRRLVYRRNEDHDRTSLSSCGLSSATSCVLEYFIADTPFLEHSVIEAMYSSFIILWIYDS